MTLDHVVTDTGVRRVCLEAMLKRSMIAAALVCAVPTVFLLHAVYVGFLI